MHTLATTCLFGAAMLSGALTAQELRKDPSPPGYWQFFAKTGALRVTLPERARDARIRRGRSAVQKLSTPLPDVRLPDETGRLVRLRGVAEGRRLLVVTYRAWW